MKVLHVVPTYLPAVRHGGPIRSIHGLARETAKRGHSVSVFTTNLHESEELDVPTDRPVDLDGVSVRYFPVSGPRRWARSPEMARSLKSEVATYDVVHIHSLFLWPIGASAGAAQRAGVPWLVSPRGMLVRDLVRRRGWLRKTLWLRSAGRRVISRAARLVVTAELEEREARRFALALPRVEMLANGVDMAVQAPRDIELPDSWPSFTSGEPKFVYLGRLSWKKGLERLLESLGRLPGVRLALAGNDEEGIGARLRAQSMRLGLSERVQFLGFVDGEAKLALLAGARALVLPSISENFGNVVLEAWALGVPVVVTSGVGLASEVLDAGGGLVAEPKVGALAEALARLANDAAMAREMGRRGRERAQERYSWPVIAERAERIYAEVIAEREATR